MEEKREKKQRNGSMTLSVLSTIFMIISIIAVIINIIFLVNDGSLRYQAMQGNGSTGENLGNAFGQIIMIVMTILFFIISGVAVVISISFNTGAKALKIESHKKGIKIRFIIDIAVIAVIVLQIIAFIIIYFVYGQTPASDVINNVITNFIR
jgi:heme/copper-type cytochrome/quinol oxidase subunit 2